VGFLQVFERFYEGVPAAEQNRPKPGHLYWAPVPETDQVHRILDVQRSSPDEHAELAFEFVEINNQHFTERDRLPIKALNLQPTHELLVAKAKKRPVLVLAETVVPDVATLPEGTQRRLAGPLGRQSYLVAPLYSVSTMMEPGTFGPTLVARIRAMQYVHLCCLPETEDSTKPASIVRLDRVFPSYLGRGCAHRGIRLHEEPFEVILSQFSIVCGGVNSEPYTLVRGLAQEALPDGLK
jgi:hypothetical protein